VDFAQLATFQAVVEAGSFDAAARALHITPSAVSQRIKALELSVGQVLVRRTKPCVATPAGEALIRFAGQVSLLEREALRQARDGTRVSIVVNADSLHTWFMPALTKVTGPSWELHTDDQDYTADLLRAGTAMAAVTAQNVVVQGCRVEPLGAMRYLPVGAPGIDIATSPIVAYNRKDALQHRFLASVAGTAADPPVHYVPGNVAFLEAIRLGLGWGMVPEQLAGPFTRLYPDRHLDVPLFWQYWRIESAVLGELTAAVKATAAAALR